MRRRIPALMGAAALAVTLVGCSEPGATASSGAAASSAAPSSTSTAALSGAITVDAAASLNQAFPALAKRFEAAHPDTTITFGFGGSSALAAAIVAGAPVDVFAAASTTTMQTVADAGLTASTPVDFARNQLEIAVPPGNPGGITGLKDFANPSKTIVVCDRSVPCGAAATRVFAIAGITPSIDSDEPDVTSVLTKVETDNADAGLVYVTDVRAAGSKVRGIPFAESDQAVTAYPIAPLKDSKNPALAAAWTHYVLQHESVLQDAGFLAP